MHFQFDYLCSVTTYNILVLQLSSVYYKTIHTILSILFLSNKNDVTSLVDVHIDY